MRRPLLKANIEPLFLTASLRFYDFSQTQADVCLECQMSDAHYADQHHPLSCDGDEARPADRQPAAAVRIGRQCRRAGRGADSRFAPLLGESVAQPSMAGESARRANAAVGVDREVRLAAGTIPPAGRTSPASTARSIS